MTTTRTYAQGSIYQRGVDGRWYGALDVAKGTGHRRRITVSGSTREAVEVRLARLRRRCAATNPDLTPARWLTTWRDELLPGTVAAGATVDDYEWAIDRHLVPGLGPIALADLSPSDVAVFLHDKLTSGLAVSTAARLRTVLATALGHAVLLGHIDRNVARLVRPRRGPRPTRTLSQSQRSETAARRGRRRPLRSGLRAHARPRAPSRRSTRAALVRRGPRPRLHDPNRRPRRPALGGPAPCPSHGAHRHRPVAPPELRHTAVSLLSAAGVRLEDVADLVGHRSTGTTSAVYRHVVVPTIHAARRPAERLFPTANG